MAGAARPDQRPLSPHVSVWRWHVTMATSILHRATGVGLYGGAVLLTIWLYAVADGPACRASQSLDPTDPIRPHFFGG